MLRGCREACTCVTLHLGYTAEDGLLAAHSVRGYSDVCVALSVRPQQSPIVLQTPTPPLSAAPVRDAAAAGAGSLVIFLIWPESLAWLHVALLLNSAHHALQHLDQQNEHGAWPHANHVI